MSCFGGLSPVLSHIGSVLRLHCGRIVCAPSGSGQESYDQYAVGPGLGQDDPEGPAGSAADGAAGLNGVPNEHAHLNGSASGKQDKRLSRSGTRSGQDPPCWRCKPIQHAP